MVKILGGGRGGAKHNLASPHKFWAATSLRFTSDDDDDLTTNFYS